MICKWCGANMDRPENPCKRCGKKPAAKSNCGGFYDLVPAARGGVQIPMPQQTIPQQAVPQQASRRQGHGMLFGILCGVLAVVIVVLLISNTAMQQENYRLEQKLDDAQGSGSPLGGALLAEEDVAVTLKVYKKDGGCVVETEALPVGTVKVVQQAALGIKYSAEIAMAEGTKTAIAQIDYHDSLSYVGTEPITLSVTLDALFGDTSGTPYCVLYYVDKDGNLVEIEMEEPEQPQTEQPQTSPENGESENGNDGGVTGTNEGEGKTDNASGSQGADESHILDGFGNTGGSGNAGSTGDAGGSGNAGSTGDASGSGNAGGTGDAGGSADSGGQAEGLGNNKDNNGGTGSGSSSGTTSQNEDTVKMPYIPVEVVDGKMVVALAREDIVKYLEDMGLSADTEIVCKLVRNNQQGGSFTAIIKGIYLQASK